MAVAAISTDPKAVSFVPRNAAELWPYRQKDLLGNVNKVLPPEFHVNGYDILCIHKIYDVLNAHPEFAYRSHPMASPQYSDAFVEWIVAQAKKDSQCFHKTRDQYHPSS